MELETLVKIIIAILIAVLILIFIFLYAGHTIQSYIQTILDSIVI